MNPVCAFCGAEHSDNIATPCCDAARRCQERNVDKQPAPVESDYRAVPEMRGTEQIGVTFERKDAAQDILGDLASDIERTFPPKGFHPNQKLADCKYCQITASIADFVRRSKGSTTQPTAQDVMAVLEDGDFVESFVVNSSITGFVGAKEKENLINAFVSAVREKLVRRDTMQIDIIATIEAAKALLWKADNAVEGLCVSEGDDYDKVMDDLIDAKDSCDAAIGKMREIVRNEPEEPLGKPVKM